jgi:hypothetical protein
VILLNDLLQLQNLNDVRIRLNLQVHQNWQPIRMYNSLNKGALMNAHYWNASTSSYSVGQTTIGLLRISSKDNLYLLFHVGVVLADLHVRNGVGYTYQTIPSLSKYFDRVIVRYKNTGQTLIRKATAILGQCEVHQILPHTYNNNLFPGYESVHLTWRELQLVITYSNWQTALQNQQGIYLLTDKSNGKMYVGSAYGQDRLLGRWQSYVSKPHGGNRQLKLLGDSHIKSNFMYSILDVYKASVDEKTIIERESWWKEVLHTRTYGYNDN